MKLRRAVTHREIAPDESDASDAPVAEHAGNGQSHAVDTTETHTPQAPKLERSGPPMGELLVQQGVVTSEEVDAALEAQEGNGQLLGAILIARGDADERQVTEALAAQFGLPVVDLHTTLPDVEALAKLDARVARDLRALPMRINGQGIAIAVDHIPEHATLEKLFDLTGMDIALVLAPASDLTRGITASYRAIADVQQFVEAFEEDSAARRPTAMDEGPEQVEENAPIIQVVSRLITEAVRERASDIHIEPQDDKVRVRFRVDGALHEPLQLPASMGQPLVSRLKIMADMNIVERRRAQDGQFVFTADGQTLDIRVATMATIWGEKIVMRILDRGKSLLELHNLGMPVETSTKFSKTIRAPFGMVICAGPTGSGKTTTLYAALNEINDPELNITTIEDPVEYVLPSINQVQINEAADITFAGGLKAILRQDPDVILVGEMRDVETARIAVQSALTGHLVLTSLHATDAASALQRFLDMGIESFLVASSVIAVVAQRLVRRICPYCVDEYVPSADEMAFYESSGGRIKAEFVHGLGCNFCSHTGYADRIGVYELLIVTDEIKELILGNATHDKLQALAASQGMRTLRDEGITLVEQDMTTIGEVMRRIYAG
jgi:type IV pilus assembly protein PilB